MAKIIILANGTMGDILPYIALGEAIQKRGHQVSMVCPEYVHYHIKAGQLSAIVSSHQKINPETAKKASLLWDNWIKDPINLKAKRNLNRKYHGLEKWQGIYQSINDLIEHCHDVDAVICNPQEDIIGSIIAEKFNVPLIQLIVTPQLIYQSNNWWRLSKWAKLKDNKKDRYQKLRHFVGLSDSETWKQYWQYNRVIFAASPHLYSEPPDVPQDNHVGFFFYNNPNWQDWQPNQELKQFVASDSKPLVLSFSSQPMRDSKEFIAIHARGAAILNRKIVIQRGWAEFNEKDLPADISSDTVMFIDFIPQEWLFSNSAAVITHGGIGTVARGLLYGCPLLIEPYTHEQCFNAYRILNWGVGAAVHPKKITPEGIARVLEKKVLTSEYKQKAEKIKTQLEVENGLEKAANLVESWLS